MDLNLLTVFFGVTWLLIVVPGPDWAFTLASGLRERAVAPAVAGLMLGYATLTVIVAGGVGVLVAEHPLVLTTLTIVGAGYLVYLGVTLAARPSALHGAPSADTVVVGTPRWTLLAKGVGVSGLNPKGLLVFLAILPQFADPAGSWPMPVQMAALGLVFTLSCGAFYSVLGLSTRAILRARPTVSSVVSRISGTAMIAVGLLLLLERMS